MVLSSRYRVAGQWQWCEALVTDWQDTDSGTAFSLQTGMTVAVVLSSRYRLAGQWQWY